MHFSSEVSTVREAKRLLEGYSEVVQQLCIPPLDKELYEVCFVSPVRRLLQQQSPSSLSSVSQGGSVDEGDRESLTAFGVLFRHLEKHRDATTRVLQLCAQRDKLVANMLGCCEFYEKCATWRADEERILLFIRDLREHQLVTLSLVEAIFDWREQLSHPFSFNVAGENYIYRILEDCAMMDASALGTYLRLNLTVHPLGFFSDDEKWREDESVDAARVRNGGIYTKQKVGQNFTTPGVFVKKSSSHWCSGDQPLLEKGDHTSVAAAVSVVRQRRKRLEYHEKYTAARVRLGEAIILGERALQRRLLDELFSIADQGRFVTLLVTPDLLLGAERGFPFAEKCAVQWRERILAVKPNICTEGSAKVLPLPQQKQNVAEKGNGCSASSGDGKGNDGSDGAAAGKPPEEKFASTTYSSFPTSTTSSSFSEDLSTSLSSSVV